MSLDFVTLLERLRIWTHGSGDLGLGARASAMVYNILPVLAESAFHFRDF